MVKLEVLTFELCPEFRQLNEESFRQYYRAKAQVDVLESLVIKPFEEGLKQATGFSDENRPESKTIKFVRLGELEFVVSTIPTEKKPSYKELYQRLSNLLAQISEDKKELELEHVRYEQGHGYLVVADYILSKLNSWREEVTGLGVRQEIDAPEQQPASPLLVKTRNYGSLDEHAAKTYVQARAFKVWTEKAVIKPTEEALKKETGYSKANIPEKTDETFLPFGLYIARIISSPVRKTNYAQIIKTMIDDLERVRQGDDELSKVYHAVKMNSQVYVRLKALSDVLARLEQEATKTDLQQKIECYPSLQ